MSAVISALNNKALELLLKNKSKVIKNLCRKNNSLREELKSKPSALSEAFSKIEELEKYNASLKTINEHCFLCRYRKDAEVTINEMNQADKL